MTKDELHNTSKEQDNKPQAVQNGSVAVLLTKQLAGFPGMPVATNIKVILPSVPPTDIPGTK